MKTYFKNLIKAFLSIGIWLAPNFILDFLQINTDSLGNFYKILINIVIITLIIIVNFKEVKFMFNDLIINHKKYFKKYFKYYFILLAGTAISNIFISFLNNDNNVATNQILINSQFKDNPFFMYLAIVFFAPLLEELIFRLTFKNILKNKYLFILLSSLIFGVLHLHNINDLLYLIPYSISGLILCHVYEDSNNIFVSISLHFLNNGIACALLVLNLLMGNM